MIRDQIVHRLNASKQQACAVEKSMWFGIDVDIPFDNIALNSISHRIVEHTIYVEWSALHGTRHQCSFIVRFNVFIYYDWKYFPCLDACSNTACSLQQCCCNHASCIQSLEAEEFSSFTPLFLHTWFIRQRQIHIVFFFFLVSFVHWLAHFDRQIKTHNRNKIDLRREREKRNNDSNVCSRSAWTALSADM